MKYYFASDVHLGLNYENVSAQERETQFLEWLEMVECDLTKNSTSDKGVLFLLGDIFDFWLEYKSVVPKKHLKVLLKLEDMVKSGVRVCYFKGNHDTWTYDYFESIGIELYYHPMMFELDGCRVVMSHGHNLMLEGAPLSYKIMYKMFNSKFVLNTYRKLVNVDLSNKFGEWWSTSSRKSKNITHKFKGEDEFVVKYARCELSKNDEIDYFVFGHLHCPTIYELNQKTKLVVLGEWVENPVYGVLESGEFSLQPYK